MANKYVTDEVRKQIGMQSEARVVEVERGAIRRFAEAIGDPNPLFNDEAASRKTRFGGMIAPPTFCRSAVAWIRATKLTGCSRSGLSTPWRPIRVITRIVTSLAGNGSLPPTMIARA